MSQREIVTLMHKLFRGDIDKSDGYVHVFTNEELDKNKIDDFLSSYIDTDTVYIYVTSQNAFECKTKDIYKNIKQHMKNHRLRIATPDFHVKILTEPTGVAVGSITNH